MKKNLFLFVSFLLLLGITYLFQEKRVERNFNEAQTRDRLISVGVTQLKLPALTAEKRSDKWWSEDMLLSHNDLTLIEKKLSEIKKLKEIKGDRKDYFSTSFSIEVNGKPLTFGDLSLDRQSFYVEFGEKIYLAYIEGESRELTEDETEIAAIKLRELLAVLNKSKESLREKQLFRFYPDLPMERVVVNLDGNLPFEIDLQNNQTLPPPLKGISVHRDLRSKFLSLLTQMRIKEEITYMVRPGFQKLGELTFLGNGEKISWELWLKQKDKADIILLDPSTKRAFSMIGGTLKGYFVRIQDYWDKKVIPPAEFKSFQRLSAKFTQGDMEAQVTILNREPLGFEAAKHRVIQEKMEQLMQFTFNLGSKDQGERVSLLSQSERRQLLSEDHLKVEIMEQDLVFWRKPQELIVANLTQGYKVHFTLLDETFNATFQDVLK